jgi:branched-chain amino acid transport system ATP-binding protein
MTKLLEVRDLHTAYGLSKVLFGVSLEIAAGECVCLLGRNGVGKSTTMRSIMGLTRPASGEVLWKGGSIVGWAPYRVARAGIGLCRRTAAFRRPVGVGRTWISPAASPGGAKWTRTPCPSCSAAAPPSPGGAGYLSGGEQQMLTIGTHLMGNPELLLLDEPSEGLAPLVVEHLLQQVTALKNRGLTILLAEQGVAFSLQLADRVYVLEKGTVRFSGPSAELRDDEALRNRLLAL